jgi:gluconolactonase
MKKKLLFFLGVLCSLGFYSCQKTIRNAEPVDLTQPSAARGHNPAIEANIFDPAHLVSPSAHGRLDTIQKGFSFTEGPAVDKHGNVFFTDQPNDKIYRWDAATGNITLFLEGTGRSNGMMFDKNGYLIACADMHGELWKIAPDGSHEVLVDNYNGKLLNGQMMYGLIQSPVVCISPTQCFRDLIGMPAIPAKQAIQVGPPHIRNRPRPVKAVMFITSLPAAIH